MCSTASCRTPARRFAEARLRPVINSLIELAEWDAFVSANNWRGGAALHVDTGMNRLGLTVEEAAAIAPRIQSQNHGIELLMSHFACADRPEPSAERPADPAVPRNPHPVSRHPVLARQFVRHLPRRHRALRPGAARRRALRRQPDAGQAATRCGRWSSSRAASCRSATSSRARPSATARPGPRSAKPARHHRGRLRRRLFRAAGAAKGKPARRGDRRRQALPDGRAHLHGPDRGRRHRPAGGRGPPRRLVTLIGDEIERRRGRRRRRHHRLRGADQPRPALLTAIYRKDLEWRISRVLRALHPNARRSKASSARTAAPPMAAGRANATPAASGTPSPRKAPRAAAPACPGRAAQGPRVRARAAHRRNA